MQCTLCLYWIATAGTCDVEAEAEGIRLDNRARFSAVELLSVRRAAYV